MSALTSGKGEGFGADLENGEGLGADVGAGVGVGTDLGAGVGVGTGSVWVGGAPCLLASGASFLKLAIVGAETVSEQAVCVCVSRCGGAPKPPELDHPCSNMPPKRPEGTVSLGLIQSGEATAGFH